MGKAYLSLGSNIGNTKENISQAIHKLENSELIQIITISKYYITKPIGYLEQPDFLNIVIFINCKCTPEELLKITQRVENQLGRTRKFKWGPRNIDIDILLFDTLILNTTELVIPHPLMFQRAFVLIPLAEINCYYKRYLKNLSEKEINGVKESYWNDN